MRTTLRLDGDLYRQAKAQAATRGVSVTELVEEAIRQYLRRSAAARHLRIRLPESTATGGLLPEFATLEEAVAAADLADGQLNTP